MHTVEGMGVVGGELFGCFLDLGQPEYGSHSNT